jgi:hypothetical protein
VVVAIVWNAGGQDVDEDVKDVSKSKYHNFIGN